MKGNSGFQIGTGVTSIFMIFVVLCLTTFATLSYTSADADLEMSNRHAEYIENYYEAYSKLNDELVDIDYMVCQLLDNADKGKYGLDMVIMALQTEISEGIYIEFTNNSEFINAIMETAINDEQKLIMELTIDLKNLNERCSVDKCYVYSENGNFTQEETLPDMWGG